LEAALRQITQAEPRNRLKPIDSAIKLPGWQIEEYQQAAEIINIVSGFYMLNFAQGGV
jgi:hypothetical protein